MKAKSGAKSGFSKASRLKKQKLKRKRRENATWGFSLVMVEEEGWPYWGGWPVMMVVVVIYV